MKLNPFRHYFMYAKGYYKQTNLLEDLHKIQCNYVGCDLGCSLTLADFIRVTCRAVDSFAKNLTAEKYAEAIMEYGKIYKGGFRFEIASAHDSILLANLGLLRHATVDDIAMLEGSVIGEPDFSILPEAN